MMVLVEEGSDIEAREGRDHGNLIQTAGISAPRGFDPFPVEKIYTYAAYAYTGYDGPRNL